MSPTNQQQFVALADRQRQIADGDLLLFRRRNLIAIAGRGTQFARRQGRVVGRRPVLHRVREWHGGRAVTLESQVAKFPGRIDVYRTNPSNRWPEYDRTRATTMMRRLAGCDYGYTAVLAAAMLHSAIHSDGGPGRS